MKMQARDLLIDFINFVLLLSLTSFCIVFFIYKDNFVIFLEIMKYFTPISFFIILLLIKSKLNKKEYNKRKVDNNLDIVLHLNFIHKAVLDIILFSSPIVILAISFSAGMPDFIDLFQALITFLLLYFWQRYLFSQDSF